MPAYNRQLKDKDDNLIYPVLNSDSIPGNAVTTAKINDGAVTSAKIGAGEVKATNIDFSTLGFGNYSETEVDTGFTWIDGSHIYKKTIKYTDGLTAGVVNYINHNITNIGKVIKREFFGYNSSTGNSLLLPASTPTNSISNWTVTTTQMLIYSTFAYGSDPNDALYFTLYYTKSS